MDTNRSLLVATMELLRQCDLSLDNSPDFRAAVAAAHQAVFASAREHQRQELMKGPALRMLPEPIPFPTTTQP